MQISDIIEKLHRERTATPDEIYYLLQHCDETHLAFINEKARKVARIHFGNKIYIRGLIEVGNCCRNDCYYCGIRRSNQNAQRYRLTEEDILDMEKSLREVLK